MRIILAGCIALILWLATPATTFAHASILRSVPATGAVLESAPAEVVLEFTEEVEPSSVHLQLLSAAGDVLSPEPPVIDPAAPKTMRLTLPPLENGAYSLYWRVQSQVDWHITNGTIAFAVGEQQTPGSILPPSGTPLPVWQSPAPLDVFQRWLSLVGMALIFGSIFFVVVIWQPLIKDPEERLATGAWLRRRVQWFVWIGSVLLVIGAALYLFRQASETALATGMPLLEPLTSFVQSRLGMLLLSRVALLAALNFAVTVQFNPVQFAPAHRVSWTAQRWWLALAISAAVLLTYTLQSHTAAISGPAFLVDYLHLVAMATWLGGLLLLLSLVVRPMAETTLPWSALVSRFSAMALIIVALLSVSGLYLAYIHVRTLEALTETLYGRLLSGKSLLFLVMLGVAAVNLFVVVPRLRQGVRSAASLLHNTVRIELVIGVMLLAVVGALTATSPAFETLEAQHRQGFLLQVEQDQVQLTVRIAPAAPGDNEFAVDLVDQREQAESVPAQVLLRFSHQTHEMGVQEIELDAVDAIRYTTRGSYLVMSGPWQGEVIVRRAGFDDVRSTFEFVMPAPAPG